MNKTGHQIRNATKDPAIRPAKDSDFEMSGFHQTEAAEIEINQRSGRCSFVRKPEWSADLDAIVKNERISKGSIQKKIVFACICV